MKLFLFFFSVGEMLKVKEEVTHERDALLKEVTTLREQMENVTAAQQKAEGSIAQAEFKINEVLFYIF